jgi:hypothetical protein
MPGDAPKKTRRNRSTGPTLPGQPPARPSPDPDDHQGATEEQVSNQRGGSGAGYDLDPKKVRDKGGVSS